MSRGTAEFVLVKRLEHGDTMSIVKHVADKYPDKFEIIGSEKEGVEEAPKPKAPRKRKIGGKGVARKSESKE